MLDRFLKDESTEMRLARTIVQSALSVAIVTAPLAIGGLVTDTTQAALATAACMCILSPIMAMLRTGNPEDGVINMDEGE